MKAATKKTEVVSATPIELKSLIDNGIPLRKAVFHTTVIFDYAAGMPMHAFYSEDWSKDMKKNKVARMWYTPYGVICEQAGFWKLVPLANVADTML